MITGRVIGEEAVITRFEGIGPKVHARLLKAVTRLTLQLQRKVKADKLSGQVLKVRTGTLRRSIDQKVYDEGTAIVGRVSTNVKYGKALEYGFKGTVNVRAHLRHIKEAFGRSITPVDVNVSAHSRKMNLAPHSFLRSALADMEASGAITREFEAALKGL